MSGNKSDMEIPSPMVYGLGSNSKASNLVSQHPLESSENTYWQRQELREFDMLRKVQGLHAPLKLSMERKITLKTGHLPFLHRSNASYDVLTGRDELITFDDYLGNATEAERVGQPHAMVERQLGLL